MFYIEQHIGMDRMHLLLCLSFLLQVKAIGLIDLFDVCNIYVLQDFEAIWNRPLLRSLLNYCRIQNLLRRTEFQFEGSRIRSQETTNPNPNPNPTLNPSESQAQSQNPAEIQSPDETPNSPSGSSPHSNPGTNPGTNSGSNSGSNSGPNPGESNANKAKSEEAEAEDEEAINDIQSLLSLFHQNVSILNILESPLFEKLRRSIDLHCFVVFCCIHRILKRVYLVPFRTSDPAAFAALFEASTGSSRRIPALSTEETVGMSMDAVGASKMADFDEVFGVDSPVLSMHNLYWDLFASFRYSIYHQKPSTGLSRHSSCLSFLATQKGAQMCSCKPDRVKVLNMVAQFQCLESIALHTHCCVPSVMRCLEELNDVLFLKLWSVCEQTRPKTTDTYIAVIWTGAFQQPFLSSSSSAGSA